MKIIKNPFIHLNPERFGMTRETFMKKSFKPYMLIDYKHPGLENPIECLLLSVDFDTEVLMLKPLPNTFLIENPSDFPGHISHCQISRKKLKAT